VRRPRPWRAVAYTPGTPRRYVGGTSAATRAGLDAFVDRWGGLGLTVDVWEVLPVPEVEAHLAATSPPGE
jgi:hypothetical protein